MTNTSIVSTVFKNVFSFTTEGKAQFIVHSLNSYKGNDNDQIFRILNSAYSILKAYLSGFFQLFISFLKSGSEP